MRMARRPVGNPPRANRPVESVTTNFWTSGAEIITPGMGRPLREDIAAPRMRALESESASACTDCATIAAVTRSMIYDTTSPHFAPSHAFTRRLALSLTYPLLGAFHRTGSPMTKGRWHESSVRDGLHF